mgnify:CR=1 FL=1
MFGHLNHGRNDGLGDGVTIVTGAGAEIVEYSTESAITAGDVLGLKGQQDKPLQSGLLLRQSLVQ